ncbi:hypothetical protein L1049_011285 [Liquidambar formosana]|uniref:Carboxypeptidase n=1 Tax=Liquidambar formosana TaxID=63359 RepID=A0AAP0WY05_LIQFO
MLCLRAVQYSSNIVKQDLGRAPSHGKMGRDVPRDFYKARSSIFDSSLFVDQIENADAKVLRQVGLKEKDRIVSLPGQPPVKFAQYGGYVTVDKSAGRALYYYFAEAEKPKKLPLLLWLNGGPGCSSLGYGAMLELGPFRILSDGKTLFKNTYAWNKAANVLFLESPAGVGYSYSNTSTDYEAGGDKNTAVDNLVFLLNWLERFPEYKGRDFYISGESYAGHYVPQLAHVILAHNKKTKKTPINLKGIMIGNAVIDDETDTIGMYDYFGSHALVSGEVIDQIHKHCDFSPNATTPSKECNAYTSIADNLMFSNQIDVYNIYAPMCFSSNVTARPKKASIFSLDPCSEFYGYVYLNRPDVQNALHANVTKLTHDWEPCSGDTDGRVPVTSTQYSIKKMDLPIKTEWRPWWYFGEVGGYTQVYKGDLTFATVRGAGHMVPSYQPTRALALISHFLAGKPLSDS